MAASGRNGVDRQKQDFPSFSAFHLVYNELTNYRELIMQVSR